jgi:hypothetical protein
MDFDAPYHYETYQDAYGYNWGVQQLYPEMQFQPPAYFPVDVPYPVNAPDPALFSVHRAPLPLPALPLHQGNTPQIFLHIFVKNIQKLL